MGLVKYLSPSLNRYALLNHLRHDGKADTCVALLTNAYTSLAYLVHIFRSNALAVIRDSD